MAYNKIFSSSGVVAYSDIDLSMKPNPLTGDIRRKTDIDAIKQSVLNLFYTNYGERPFRPDLAGGLNQLLFEPNDEITTIILEERLKRVIENYEPRVRVIELKVSGQELDDNSKSVLIKYQPENALEPQEINIMIKRLR